LRRYIAAVDLFCNAMALFLMCVILMRPLLNPPTEDAKAEPPGNLTVHIVWPVGNTDVDLWVHGPGEPRAIGYSRKSGKLWDLLRDDLGTVPDATGINFESAYTRGVVAGAYTINVHAYRVPTVPIVVQVEVALSPETGPLKVLFTTTVTLTKQGQEKTAVRFYLEADGTVRPGSVHAVFKPLRSAKP
jgi:hypothetical protein